MRLKRKVINILIAIISLGIGAGGMYYLIAHQGLFVQTFINKLEREVTINDQGIADAVEKLYDAVVVVNAFRGNTARGSGTGFIYKVEGNTAYVITNSHVVANSNRITLKFTDEKFHEAKLVGADEYSDIAVLSIDKDKIISVADLGSSEEARLGDTVFAIGAPVNIEYSWTVTRGILSGKDRIVEINLGNAIVNNWAMRVLQTDTAINPGNSGGPLANSNGEVIGVTNMKLVDQRIEGIGFAIPIEDAINTADELIKHGSVARPVLGVETLDARNIQDLRRNCEIILDATIISGAVICATRPDSVADKAGLQKGDVIIKIGDYEITNSAKLRYFLYRHKVGDKTTVTYIRDNKTNTVDITLSDRLE